MLYPLISSIVGYLLGSIPWALVIGEVFFHKDIRNYGSGNLGGTNAGRVLGTPIGYLVIVLDASKALLAMILVHCLFHDYEIYAGLLACIGHCYPVFADFRGGKAVASFYGYLLGISIYITGNIVLTFLLPVLSFFIIVLITKYVSLASMISTLIGGISILLQGYIPAGICAIAISLFIVYRHRANIKRILHHEESKFSFHKNKGAQ